MSAIILKFPAIAERRAEFERVSARIAEAVRDDGGWVHECQALSGLTITVSCGQQCMHCEGEPMNIGGARMGDWAVRSEIDVRWNKSGRGFGTVTGGGPQELKDWVEHCRREFGEPPADLEASFFKDW